ncbi:MAG: glycosyltransferase [Terriglobales bacterium]
MSPALPSPRAHSPRPIRVLALIEAYTLTGPAKNLLGMAQRAALVTGAAPAAEFTLASFRRGAYTTDPFLAACRQSEVPVTVIPERFAFDPAVLPALRSAVDRHAPDIVQTHGVKSHFLVRLSGISRRYPWIAFHHGYTRTNLKVAGYNQLDRFTLPAAAGVVTVCGAFAAELERMGVARERILVRHNSVRPFLRSGAETVARVRREFGLAPDAFVVLSVGRLSKEKGHADLIAAFARWQLHAPSPASLVIVGGGPEKPALERAARAQGMGNRVVFTGQQTDLAPFYSLARLLVLPSHSEGSPNVLLEAMAAGLPIVATRVGGVPEIVTEGSEALLVPSQDPEALAAAMQRLAEDDSLRRQLSARATLTAARYSPEAYHDSILSLYQNCLAAIAPLPGGAAGSNTLSALPAAADRRK